MPPPGPIPGIKKLPKPRGEFAWYWVASQVARDDKKFYPRTRLLWRGVGEPSSAELAIIKVRANELTVELYEHLSQPHVAGRRKLGSVYFIRSGDKVKIGFSREVNRRLAQLRTALPGGIQVLMVRPGTPATERAWHRRFRDLRCSGEWFRYEGELRALAEAGAQQ